MKHGEHLLQSTRVKILRGKFIDFFSRLYQEIEKKDKELLDKKEKEVLNKHKVERTWTNWISEFLIYTGVKLRQNTMRGLTLLQYLDIV